MLDIDASLVEIHSDNKQGTAANYKHGFGFHSMLCFADATGEALAAVLRSGNATANGIADHLAVLDAALAQLPTEIAAGHHLGDDRAAVRRPVQVRTDSAGGSHGFVQGCRDRNVGFGVVARQTPSIHAAISAVQDDQDGWVAAIDQRGGPLADSSVRELTNRLDLSAWPPGTRLIVRREPRHPGAQTWLFPNLEFRYWGHYTDQAGDPATLDAHMRAHAHVEDHIGRLKTSGLLRFPFVDEDANRAWLAVVCFAADIVRWFQLLCLDGELASAQPKRLRWTLWHTPGRLVRRACRRVVRILDGWPTADELLAAYQRLDRRCCVEAA